MNKTTITSIAAVAAACFAGSSAFAGTPTQPVKPSKNPPPPISESCITGDIGFDIVSEYISKGLPFEDSGLIIQPYANLHFRLYKGSGAVSSVTADVGIWNSFHEKRTGAGAQVGAAALAAGSTLAQARAAEGASTTGNWFEFDFLAGLTVGVDKFSISPYFKTYESPSDAFRTAYTMGVNVGYDDTDLLGVFALHPHVLFERSMSGTTGNGDGNGNYWELGVAPAHSYGDLTLTLPVNLGLGSAGFYVADETFGFVSAGIDAAYVLNFVPSCLGKWTTHVGFTYYYLGEDSARLSDDAGANHHYVVGGGLKVAF